MEGVENEEKETDGCRFEDNVVSVDESEAASLIVVNHSVNGSGSDKDMVK